MDLSNQFNNQAPKKQYKMVRAGQSGVKGSAIIPKNTQIKNLFDMYKDMLSTIPEKYRDTFDRVFWEQADRTDKVDPGDASRNFVNFIAALAKSKVDRTPMDPKVVVPPEIAQADKMGRKVGRMGYVPLGEDNRGPMMIDDKGRTVPRPGYENVKQIEDKNNPRRYRPPQLGNFQTRDMGPQEESAEEAKYKQYWTEVLAKRYGMDLNKLSPDELAHLQSQISPRARAMSIERLPVQTPGYVPPPPQFRLPGYSIAPQGPTMLPTPAPVEASTQFVTPIDNRRFQLPPSPIPSKMDMILQSRAGMLGR